MHIYNAYNSLHQAHINILYVRIINLKLLILIEFSVERKKIRCSYLLAKILRLSKPVFTLSSFDLFNLFSMSSYSNLVVLMMDAIKPCSGLPLSIQRLCQNKDRSLAAECFTVHPGRDSLTLALPVIITI